MKYEIINDLSAEDIMYMRKLLGWGKDIKLDQWNRALNKTMCKVTIKNDNEIIGIGRLVGDYTSKGLLSDIIVNPKYQKMGFGKIIVTNLINQVYNYLNDGEFFQIEASPTYGNRDFYIKCGMKYKPKNQDGVYLWIQK